MLDLVFDLCFIDFGKVLGGNLVDLGCQVECRVDQKIYHMASCWEVSRNHQNAKNDKGKIDEKASTDRSKIK